MFWMNLEILYLRIMSKKDLFLGIALIVDFLVALYLMYNDGHT
jgi:hypothetical protein